MKKELGFEIKRLLQLTESKLGDIKPILYQRKNYNNVINEEGEIDRRQQFAEMLKNKELPGCKNLANFGSSGVIDDAVLDMVTNAPSLAGLVRGKAYAKADCFIKETGNNKQLFVFNVIDPKNPNGLVVLAPQYDKNQKIIGAQMGVKDLSTSAFGRETAYTADQSNLSYEQQQNLQNLIDRATNLTGTRLVAKIPSGEEPRNWEPIDLNTGKGVKNQIQYIPNPETAPDSPLNPSNLTPIYKVPGKFYVWAEKAAKNMEMYLVDQVEKYLGKDYTIDASRFEVDSEGNPTHDNPVPGTLGFTDPRYQKPITLQTWCKENPDECGSDTPMGQYVTKFANTPLKLYPLKTQEMRRQDVSDVGLTKRGSRKTTRKASVDSQTCKAAFETLKTVITKVPYKDPDQFEEDAARRVPAIKTYGGSTILKGPGKSNVAIVRDILDDCKYSDKVNQNLINKIETDPDLNGSHQASMTYKDQKPVEKKSSGISGGSTDLAESISKSIRTVLKEHTKPNSDDMIKKAIRNNIKRFL